MPVIIQSQFSSAVVEANLDVFTRSYTERENTIIEFDMRKRDWQKEAGISHDVYWPEKTYNVDMHEFSVFHNPIVYRFISGQAWYYDDQNRQIWFTPNLREVSVQQHVSKGVLRLACFLAVICGVSLRNIATIFTVLFRIPVSKSSVKRWIDTIGSNLPSEEKILKQLLELKKTNQCHIDGYYPIGTNNCVMVIKDESDRILRNEHEIRCPIEFSNVGPTMVTCFEMGKLFKTHSLLPMRPLQKTVMMPFSFYKSKYSG